MSDHSPIEWTEATWNPSTGCTKISPGCKHCYAERLANRLQKMNNPKYKNGFHFIVHPDALDLPTRWKKPKRIFVNSMSDLFHEEMPIDFLRRCFEVMSFANHHIYQVLTKRPERMLAFVREMGKRVPKNIWLGTSVESAKHISRIELLQKVPVGIRFVSCEPLLGALGQLPLSGISWVIVGGESGPGHRPILAEWVREIRDQCVENRVGFFFKQWGGKRPKSGGRMLDGKEWNQYPGRHC